jgi:hypothetical protein
MQTLAELPLEQAKDYETVKKALMDACKINHYSYMKEFRTTNKLPDENYLQFAFRLESLQKFWLQALDALENPEAMRQVFLCEQFISTLPPSLAMYISDHRKDTLAETAKVLDNYMALKDNMKSNLTENKSKIAGSL